MDSEVAKGVGDVHAVGLGLGIMHIDVAASFDSIVFFLFGGEVFI